MSELYGDQYDSATTSGLGGLIPEGVRRAAGAASFVALVAAMGTWAYQLGTRDAAEVPIIRAMEGPTRVQPDDPGGAVAAHQGLEVNAVLAGAPAPSPTSAPLAPAPEILTAEDGPQGELVIPEPDGFAAFETVADGDLRMPLGDEPPGPVDGHPLDDATDASPFAQTSPDPTLDPGRMRTQTMDALVAAAIAAEAAPEPAAAGMRPRSRPADLVLARASAPVDATRAEPAIREVADLAPGARLVQLGAFDSEAITREAWGEFVDRHGDLLGAKSLYVERTTANARVFYRLRVAGFADADETLALCEALRARGVDCIPVTFQ